MSDLLQQHVRTAVRGLTRTPLFALVAVLSIAIGSGATTGIVTLFDTMLLRPPPGVGHAERLVTVGRTQDGRGFDNFSYPTFEAYRKARSLSGLAALQLEPQAASLGGPGGGEPVHVSPVSGNLFTVLEAHPALGRFFAPDEDSDPGANPVVVLSHGFWTQRFGADPSIVGRPIVLNGTPFTVIGVAAKGFQGPFAVAPDGWVPLAATTRLGMPANIFSQQRGVWLIAIGRLAPSASLDQAQAELSTIATRLAQDDPDAYDGKGVAVERATLFPGDMGPAITGFLALLLAIAGLVLVIASTNVAGMLLARAAARRREIAVRLALGASRGQLVGQLVIECLLLFGAAGVAGLVIAHWLVAGLLTLVPRLPVPLALDPRLDWRVLGFALVLSLVTGLLAGIVPAFQSTHPDLVPALKAGGGSGGGPRLRLRSGLVVAQIALSMVLLMVAGLFARTLAHARAIDPGFDSHDVYFASLDLGLANYEEDQGQRAARAILDQVRALPGVRAAALAAMLPLGGGGLGLGDISVAGRQPPDPRRGWDADWNVVTPGYFAALGTPLVRGRDFSTADRAGSADVAILNEALATALFGDVDPVGRSFTNEGRSVTVIGVARNAKYRTIVEAQRNFVYVPLSQHYFGRANVLVKMSPGAVAPGAEVRGIVSGVDPALPILRQGALGEQTATALFPQRIALLVSGGLGVVALLLVLLGIYGVTAYAVTQRTREIGVRVALGAQRSHVLALVLRQGLGLAGIGVAAGALVALGASRLIRGLLYGVGPTDVVALGGAAALLALAALVASWIPARRAARLDPVVALRSE
jgi:putative ABC transport system permease protein